MNVGWRERNQQETKVW